MASPVIRKPISFQCPKGCSSLMYSSARLIPPLNATMPSTTIILRWSRLFNAPLRTISGLNFSHLIPFFRRDALFLAENVPILPISSYSTLISTPSCTFCSMTLTMDSHRTPSCTIKYSINTYRFASFNADIICSNKRSPIGKYTAVSFLKTGKPVIFLTYAKVCAILLSSRLSSSNVSASSLSSKGMLSAIDLMRCSSAFPVRLFP